MRPRIGARSERRSFWRIAAAGAAFQGATAAVDSATVVAALVYELTGSAFAVGFASAVLRLGWLLPQMVVGFLATHSRRRMPYYMVGAYGRAVCASAIAALLWLGAGLPHTALAAGFLGLWTAYAFVSGIVAVPYNDIVGRSVPSKARSRMLAWRFFGGGALALGVAAFAGQSLETLPPLEAFALIFALAAVLMLLSSTLFVSAGEPAAPAPGTAEPPRRSPGAFLAEGCEVLRRDRRFRLFLFSQWLGGATLMALPFYMVAATEQGVGVGEVGLILAAQTVGSLASNPLWGWVGDRLGKLRLLLAVCGLRLAAPMLALGLIVTGGGLAGFVFLFFWIGVLMNGMTIGYLGFLMEISPNDRRPAYSAYFNALASPAALLPLVGAAFVAYVAIEAVFAAAAVAALAQFALSVRIAPDRETGSL